MSTIVYSKYREYSNPTKKKMVVYAIVGLVLGFITFHPQTEFHIEEIPDLSVQEVRTEESFSKAALKISSVNKNVSVEEAEEIVHHAKKYGEKFNLDPALLLGVMHVESTFNRFAISNSGAFGLMQLLPRWHNDKIIKAREKLGNPELFSVETNIFLGAWVLKDCIKKFKQTDTALKCYNGSVGTNTNYHEKVLESKRKFDPYI